MGEGAEDSLAMRRRIVQQLESLQRAGVTHLPRAPRESLAPIVPTAPTVPTVAVAPTPPVTRAVAPSVVAPNAPKVAAQTARAKEDEGLFQASTPRANLESPTRKSLPVATPAAARSAQIPPVGAGDLNLAASEREAALSELRDEVCQCRLCPMLVANRSRTVFGVGTVTPRLVFFGEAPGEDEDRTGEPFVGRAGQLLDKMIAAMTLRREDVYILNVLKCRPPGNRRPNPEEAENCRPFFERQLEILRPEYICCLGASAAQTLLRTQVSIGRLRGKFYTYGSSRVIATYHPSYLLRTESAKRDAWNDLKLLMAEMGLKRPESGAS